MSAILQRLSINRLGGARLPRSVSALIAVLSIILAGLLIAASVDRDALSQSWNAIVDSPFLVIVVLGSFGCAFALRAIAWHRVLPGLSLGQALAGIHLALGANHVLPMRLGEPMRVVSAVRRSNVSFEEATASTVTLRAGDIVTVVAVGWLIAPTSFARIVGPWVWLVVLAVAVVGVLGWRRLRDLARSASGAVVRPGATVFVLTAVAWLFEAVVIWQSAQWAGINLSPFDAVLVTTIAVSAQVAAIAPGGFGTYEAASVAAYAALGHDPGVALAAALTAHGLKTAYSLVAGGVALVAPQPTMLGRFRLSRSTPAVPTNDKRPDSDAPILLFMPALNEEASVGKCVARVPAEVLGHRVECLVIDDGSSDRTAEVARAAGATVISFPETQGLGAGVRFGLHHGAASGAAAVAFCDADEEYPPEELANLVRPILDGQADYVIGSRFAGTIEHMRPHRRFGNVVLTMVVSFIVRRKVTDGQSGYRAFSPAAAADAEVIHDFNYAQVLTLDLLAKGYRYHEVPISYRFRTSGDSFIKLGGYLRKVIPAVYAELNDKSAQQGPAVVAH